jgi:hypothetical protein
LATKNEGSHKLHLSFVDADGKSIMPGIDIPVQVVMPPDSHFGTRNFIINIQATQVSNTGLYSIDLAFERSPASQ